MKKHNLFKVLIALMLAVVLLPLQPAVVHAEDTLKMYRLYNPNSGEHFYTADETEKDNVVKAGWKYEGIGWYAPSASTAPVYRLYNPNAGDHHYTTDLKESEYLISVGWNFEGIGWYSDTAKTVAVYRQYNPNAIAGAHNFTVSKDENDYLASVGWHAEGIGWYGSATPEDQSANTTAAITTKDAVLYVTDPKLSTSITLSFANNQTDIPLLDMSSAVETLNSIYHMLSQKSSSFTMKDNNKVITLTRDDGSQVDVNFNDKTISYYDFDNFLMMPDKRALTDTIGDDNALTPYVKPTSDSTILIKASPIQVYAGEYNIPMYYKNGKGYIPLTTFSDMFLSPNLMNITYNGKEAFLTIGAELGALNDLFYKNGSLKGSRSQELATFSYNEMVMALDLYYSLKSQHGVTSFASAIEAYGLTDDFQSTDPNVSWRALKSLAAKYLGDAHSSARHQSYLADEDPMRWATDGSAYLKNFIALRDTYKAKRDQAITANEMDALSSTGYLCGYEVEGDTAYITFDEFSVSKQGYRDHASTSMTVADTIDLISYANEKIKARSDIKNVVVDLSHNGGGSVNAAIYVASWMLGSCTMNTTDSLTGAKTTITYQADVDMSGKYDSRDTVAGSKNVYCLISQGSFSCGNLLPSLLKDSGIATLLGKTTGGGTGAVQPLSLADGSLFTVSGLIQLSTVKNGNYYDIDNGVDPDYSITQISSFYNRKGNLTTWIDGLK